MRASRRRLGIVALSIVVALGVKMAHGADGDPPRYVGGGELRSLLTDVTLMGVDWAEYYTPDGMIIGKGRWVGIVRRYSGRWSTAADHVCYHYGHKDFDTCSRLARHGDRVLHFALDGKPKKDGVASRWPGDRLSDFR